MDSRPSVKHVLGVLEWFYMLPEKILFKKSSMVFSLPSLTLRPPVWQKTTKNTGFFRHPSLIQLYTTLRNERKRKVIRIRLYWIIWVSGLWMVVLPTSVNKQPVATGSRIRAAEILVKPKTWRKHEKAEIWRKRRRYSGSDLLRPSFRAQYQLTASRAATLQKHFQNIRKIFSQDFLRN